MAPTTCSLLHLQLSLHCGRSIDKTSAKKKTPLKLRLQKKASASSNTPKKLVCFWEVLFCSVTMVFL